MNETYVKLFLKISENIEALAEQALEINTSNKDSQGIDAATAMKNMYIELTNSLGSKNFSINNISRADFARLLVGAHLITQQIKDRIENDRKALQGYQLNLIPKLNRIIEETKTDAEARTLAEGIFKD